MATTSPARIDDDLYASAKLAGEVQSRSASQQVAHWARIGREFEASASISHKAIADVLAGSRSYDALSPEEQAFVRAQWSASMDSLREGLNLAARFSAEHRAWVELDEDGTVVERRHRAKRPSAPSSQSSAARTSAVRKESASKAGGAAPRSKRVAAKGKGRPATEPAAPARRRNAVGRAG